MSGRNARALVAATRRDRPAEVEARRVALGRVRLRSLARVGFSIGWIISLLPSLFTASIVAWVLHGIWTTLDGWTPWSPWPPDTRILAVELPTPEFAPREALRLEGLYRRLEPIGHHPFIGGVLITLALTIVGGLVFTLLFTLAGLAYNLFAGITGGIEFELNERAPRSRVADTDEWDEAELRW